MHSELTHFIGQTNAEATPTSIPNDYYGISFDEWFEIFLEYAFVVSGQGDKDEAYDILAAAADASVWYHYKDKVRQIHICWFSESIRDSIVHSTFTHVYDSVRSSSIR